jgi:hypothetical protein
MDKKNNSNKMFGDFQNIKTEDVSRSKIYNDKDVKPGYYGMSTGSDNKTQTTGYSDDSGDVRLKGKVIPKSKK